MIENCEKLPLKTKQGPNKESNAHQGCIGGKYHEHRNILKYH